MIYIDYIIVGILVIGASAYLLKTFWPKANKSGCGCGSVDCKVPKPEIETPKA